MKQKKYGFTLVELIVVATIIGILATIGFVSYTDYIAGTRDSARISSLKIISEGLESYKRKGKLMYPDDYVEVKTNGTVVGYQGYAGETVLEGIGLKKGGKDPGDSTFFSYYISSDRKYFQVMAFLEESENLFTHIPSPPSPLSLGGEWGTITPSPLKGEGWGEGSPSLSFSPSLVRRGLGGGIPQAHALTDYTDRFVTVSGYELGILTASGTNTPIQEVTTITNSGYLDVMTTTDIYIAHASDTTSTAGTGAQLISGLVSKMAGDAYQNCNDILSNKSYTSGADGIYTIKPIASEQVLVYCDMTTDGGGWTLVSKSNGTDNKHIGTTPVNIGNLSNIETTTSGYIGDTIRQSIGSHYKIITQCEDTLYFYITNSLSFNEYWSNPNTGCLASTSYASDPTGYSTDCDDDAGTSGTTVSIGFGGINWARPGDGQVGVGIKIGDCAGSSYGKTGLLFVK